MADSCPGPVEVGVVAVPEAVSDTITSEFDPIREIVRDRVPVPDGRNCTLKGTLAPAPSVIGAVIPRTCKSELVPAIELMVTAEDVLFVSVFCRVLLLPTSTVPKSRLAAVTTTLPPPPEDPADKLWHPVRKNEHKMVRNKPSQTQRT